MMILTMQKANINVSVSLSLPLLTGGTPIPPPSKQANDD
jgi:hypothetical protein